MRVIQIAAAIHIIDSLSLFKEIVWFLCLSWVCNSTLWWHALWHSGIFFFSFSSRIFLSSQASDQWLGFYEADGASGELEWMRDSPQGQLTAMSAVNDCLCVWSLWSPRGYCGRLRQPEGYQTASQHPSGTTAEGASVFLCRNLGSTNKTPMIISLL